MKKEKYCIRVVSFKVPSKEVMAERIRAIAAIPREPTKEEGEASKKESEVSTCNHSKE